MSIICWRCRYEYDEATHCALCNAVSPKPETVVMATVDQHPHDGTGAPVEEIIQ